MTDLTPATAALTTNAPCAVLLVPPITTGGLLRLTSLTVKVSDDEMWGRLNGCATAARRPDPETWGGCPLALCYFTEEGVCRTHPDGCPEHDCQWCQPDFSDYGGTHGFGY